MNVFMAIYEEHKARTHHDVYAQRPLSTLATSCRVCLWLDAEKRDLEKAEREYYENEQLINEVDPLGQG